MAHPSQRDNFAIVKENYAEYFDAKIILEVGSLNLNGSIRTYFKDCRYIGCDVADGRDVDIAIPGQMLEFPSGYFDVVVSTECFEHNPYWIETLSNMLRMLKSDGMMIISCASAGRGEHGTARTSPEHSPLTCNKGWKYYKNLVKKDFSIFHYDNWLNSYLMIEGSSNNDLFFIGFGKDSKFQIHNKFIIAVRNSMKYTLWSFVLYQLNKILGNYLFQELYLLVRKYAPFLLRSK